MTSLADQLEADELELKAEQEAISAGLDATAKAKKRARKDIKK